MTLTTIRDVFLYLCVSYLIKRFMDRREGKKREEKARSINCDHLPPPAFEGVTHCADEPICHPSGPWAVLGISPTDDLAVVKKAYRSLVKKYHPDTTLNPEAKARFHRECSRINEAYREVLDQIR